MKNLFLDAVQNGKQPIGTFSQIVSAATVEGLAAAGLDYVIIDNEHASHSPERIRQCIIALEARGVTPFVRIPDTRRGSVLTALDAGAGGLIVPAIRSLTEVRELVDHGKFPPTGRRGMCYSRTSGWGTAGFAGDIGGYQETCNRETLLFPQCETRECLDLIDAVLAVDGVDGIFVGPFDLSCELGIAGQYDHPDFTAAIARILDACGKAGKPSIIFAGSAALAKRYLDQGFRSVTVSTDISVMISGFEQLLNDLR